MEVKSLVDKIEHSRDQFGVITADSLHNQLNGLSPGDWKEAANIYSKSATNPGGFYITDDAGGHVTIHNDLTKAHKLADNSVISATVDDAKSVAIWTAAAVASTAALWGWATADVASAVPGGAILSAEALGAGAAAAGSAAVTLSEIAAVGAVAAVGVDLVRNGLRKGSAEEDIRTAGQLSFDGRKGS